MDLFKKLFKLGKEKSIYMILSLILAGVSTIFSFVSLYYFWQLIININTNSDIEVIKKISLSMFLMTLIYIVLYFLSLIFSHIFAFRIETNIKKKGIENLLDSSFSFFDINSSGKVRQIIDDNSSNTHTIVAHILPDSVVALITPICLIILSFLADYRVGILVIIVILLSLVCFKYMYSDQDSMKQYMSALEDINSETVEFVRGIQVIKIFKLTLQSFEKLHKSILNYSDVVNRISQLSKIPYVAFQVLVMSFPATIILVAYSMINDNYQSYKIVSLVIFFMSFVGLISNIFLKIMFFSKNFMTANDTIKKLENIYDEMAKNKVEHKNIYKMSSYDIEFENVDFEYEEGNLVLDKLNLKFEQGKKYALIGKSGGGKSTIVKLISGFYPIKNGNLKIGGINISDYSYETIIDNISFVFQDAKLFNKSIYDNVVIGRPVASYDEVMNALKLAQCDSILDKLPQRENTVVGSKSVSISGGEKQRIAIARAILKNSNIIILDEACASSDTENEYQIQKALSKLMKNKTVIMIAHRLSSIRNVDEILVVDEGKIVERGTHDELINQDGQYRYFVNLYNKSNDWRM